MEEALKQLAARGLAEIEAAKNAEALYMTEVAYLGRKGELTLLFKQLTELSPEERKHMGIRCNEIKAALTEAIERKAAALENTELEQKLTAEWVDITMPGTHYSVGHMHPLSQIQFEVEQIFERMGFSVMDGPEIESEYYNFEGLNIPEHHPARDMQDTFFVIGATDISTSSGLVGSRASAAKGRGASVESSSAGRDRASGGNLGFPQKKHGRLVLRTHTSPVQVRTMEKYGAPLRVIVPGRTFRNEATDASHEHTFHQVEGLLIDRNISMADLKGVMESFLGRLFGEKVKVRFRPGYFPFVEPGMELDFSCLICDNKGCKVCKHTGWMEFMGCGMTHPNVLRAGGIDPKKYQGWAFGFGMERLAMMRYGINDIRLFQGGDLRFLQQF